MTAMTAMRGSVTHPRESSLPHGSPPSMANILTEHVTESLAFSPASVVIDSVAAANTLLYSQQSDSFSHPSDLLSPQLSDLFILARHQHVVLCLITVLMYYLMMMILV